MVLPPETVRVLQEHRRHQAAERLKAGDTYENHGLVFASLTGQPLEHRLIARRHFDKIVAATNLPPIRPYDLRHAHATLLLTAGVNPKIVSERLGHSSIGQTLDTYSHVLPDMQQESAERSQTLLFGT